MEHLNIYKQKMNISVNPTRLRNNPLELSESEISNLYKKIMEKYIQ